ncbi:hypothetical protein A9Q91_03320 [Candidatus Gracilibacteria bacterium 28_42_T64]|nr:hypothetical protein A9Q91_03320 [Candidatus Gracilibacteria bacterium 28_42_T64]
MSTNSDNFLDGLRNDALAKLENELSKILNEQHSTKERVHEILTNGNLIKRCVETNVFFEIKYQQKSNTLKLNGLTIEIILNDIEEKEQFSKLKENLGITKDIIRDYLFSLISAQISNSEFEYTEKDLENIDVYTFLQFISKLKDAEILNFFINSFVLKQMLIYSTFPYNPIQLQVLSDYCKSEKCNQSILKSMYAHFPLIQQIIDRDHLLA